MRRVATATAVALAVVVGWTTEVAGEDGWLAAVHQLEESADEARLEAEERQSLIEELDSHLSGTLADTDAARRVTEDLRREVGRDVIRWDSTTRRAERLKWGEESQKGRLLLRAMSAAELPATESWRGKVALLSRVSDDVEASDALLVDRGRLDVERAFWRGRTWSVQAERQAVIDEVSAGEASEELATEIEDRARALSTLIEELETLPTDEDFHRKKGALLPPVNASPTHGFGPRQREDSNTEVRHTGVTYLIDSGAEVRNVAAGRVVVAERFPGFGLTVIVDHGADHHSVYAHLEEFSVEVGDVIEAREVVGLSGDSGSLEGEKLYFELRRHGQAVDPEEWFVTASGR